MQNDMKEAYEIARFILQKELSQSDKDAIGSLGPEDVLVVPGKYDHMEEVLGLLGVPYTAGVPNARARSSAKLILANCPGDVLEGHLRGVKLWVRHGGYLVTTDWAIRPLQEMFPRYIRWTGETTADTHVALDATDKAADSTTADQQTEEQPIWWLEGSSYPFRVTEDVEILLTSQELKQRYGSRLVAVRWTYGQGEVFHMISHLYLQRTELRSARSTATFKETAGTYGVTEDELSTLSDNLQTVTEGALKASLASSSFFYKILGSATKAKTGSEAGSSTRRRRSTLRWVD